MKAEVTFRQKKGDPEATSLYFLNRSLKILKVIR